MDTLAAELSINSRTLRRYLEREGTSFRQLLDEVRERLAIELLEQTGLTVEEISKRLGYTETASFTHAFARWTGQSPSGYRRSLRLIEPA